MSGGRNSRWIIRIGATQRLALALIAGGGAFVVQPASIALDSRVVASWDLGTLIYLGLAWALIALSSAKMTRDHARVQDPSRYIIFLAVVGAAWASVVAIGYVVSGIEELAFWPRTWHLTLTIVALISAWLLIQTVFAFHYARRYYEGGDRPPSEPAALLFPGGRDPDYLDFAYYSLSWG